jgi:ankyrin repeat protein
MALQAAAREGHEPALDMLLKAGADVNARGSKDTGITALHAAIFGKNRRLVDKLLDAGAR